MPKPHHFLFSTLLLLLAAPLFADEAAAPSPTSREALTPAFLDSWQEKLGKARRDLDNADYEGVLRKTGKIQAEMKRFALDPEPRLAGLVAQTFLLRSLAMAAHANKIDTLFDYHAAVGIDPAIGRMSAEALAAYGAPGGALVAAIAAERQAIAENLSDDQPASPPRMMTPTAAGEIAALATVVPAPLAVEMVIDRMGRIRQPRLSAPLHPLLALAVFAAVREARFESAKEGGQPVMVRFQLRIAG